jgi:hypothetical protein
MSSGFDTVIAMCQQCGQKPEKRMMAYPVKLFDLSKLEVWKDNSKKSEPCAHCGAKTGSQWHHWAPRSVFADADSWPGAYLCPKCHENWHIIIRDFDWKNWRGYR